MNDVLTSMESDDSPTEDEGTEVTEQVEVDDAADAADDDGDSAPTEDAGPTDEQIAKALGVDVADLGKFKNLSKWEKDVNRQSTEIGVLRKQIAELQDTKPASDDDSDLDLDEASMRTLQHALGKILGVNPSDVAEVVSEFRSQSVASVDTAFVDFMNAHPTISTEDLAPYIEAMEVPPPKTGKRATAILETAYKAYRADNELTDDAIQKRAEEIARKLVAERVKDGEEVKAIKPARGKSAPSTSTENPWDDPNASMTDMFKRLREG